MDRIEREFRGKVKFVIKFNPYKYRDFSRIAAEAALCAGEQGKFREMHKLLLKKSPKLDRSSLISYAGELKLNVEQFTEALDSKKNDATIERDMKLARDLDLFVTPAFFINGRKIEGKVPYEHLRKIIVEELKGRQPDSRGR